RQELFALSDLLRREPRLRKTLADIGVPAEAKEALVGGLLRPRLDARTLALFQDLVGEDSVNHRLRAVLQDLGVQALLAEADAQGTLGDVADRLFRFSRVVESQAALRSAFTNPVLPEENKRALVRDLLAGRAPEQAVLLAEWAVVRVGDPVQHLAELADRAAERRHRVVAEARTAVPLDDDRVRRLSEALERVAGRPVDVEVVVDPSVVGGVVARVGDEVIDGTVRRKLDLALAQLTA
ncbi:MAG TPA: F0F1 ATP synthase subunit delta, partial [Actinomycetota bacterium]